MSAVSGLPKILTIPKDILDWAPWPVLAVMGSEIVKEGSQASGVVAVWRTLVQSLADTLRQHVQQIFK